jgi:hypothetical protein
MYEYTFGAAPNHRPTDLEPPGRINSPPPPPPPKKNLEMSG